MKTIYYLITTERGNQIKDIDAFDSYEKALAELKSRYEKAPKELEQRGFKHLESHYNDKDNTAYIHDRYTYYSIGFEIFEKVLGVK